MLKTPESIQLQLSDAITFIGKEREASPSSVWTVTVRMLLAAVEHECDILLGFGF